jgi:hypothetical protein
MQKKKDNHEQNSVLDDSDSQPAKKETRKRPIKTKPKAIANGRTHNAYDDPNLTENMPSPQPLMKRRRALPNITTASPQKHDPFNYTSPVQPILARTKIMVIPDTTEDLPISPLSTASSIETSQLISSQVSTTSITTHHDDRRPSQPSFIGILDDDCLLCICKILGEQSINNLFTFMGVCRRWRMVALSPSAVSRDS